MQAHRHWFTERSGLAGTSAGWKWDEARCLGSNSGCRYSGGCSYADIIELCAFLELFCVFWPAFHSFLLTSRCIAAKVVAVCGLQCSQRVATDDNNNDEHENRLSDRLAQ